uniref:Uncharacterized protein n=1 Tax=Rhizophora mucronata TaxID=61149 RepID=A0A2P2Q5R8_RHIMU
MLFWFDLVFLCLKKLSFNPGFEISNGILFECHGFRERESDFLF